MGMKFVGVGVIRQWIGVMWLASIALAATLPSTGANGKPLPSASPNIILITLDTTRADRMGFLGSSRGLTPNLDAFAKQAVVFTRAYAQAPLTSVSHATILSGTYPQFHQVLDFPMPLSKDVPWVPDLLHARGYHTGAFLASLALDPVGGAPGFDRGFDTYDAGFKSKDFEKLDRYHTIERRGSEVVDRATAWLDKQPKGPFFLWVHLYDAHDPYDPPEPYKTKFAKEPYDGEIAYVDFVVGKLFDELKAKGLFNGAVIAMMADHGEALGAHGEDTHGILLYDETIHVPLVIKLPNRSAEGERIDNRVELVDVMPTLLQQVGITIPSEVQGEPLLGLMKIKTEGSKTPDPWRDRPAYSQADYPHLAYGWSALQSLRSGKYLFVQAPHRELYDDTVDQKAERNLANTSGAIADTLSGQIEALRTKTTSQREAPKVEMDSARQEKLAALGYVGSSGPPKPTALGTEIDPKDKIQTANTIRQVNFLLQDRRFAEAIPMLEQLIADSPSSSILYVKLAGCYLSTRDYQKAIPTLRKAVELDPTYMMSQVNLAMALEQTQDFAGAVPVLEAAIAREPRLVDAHVLLELAYARSNRVPEAIQECHKVLEFLPDHFRSHLILGRLLARSGNLQKAVPFLEKAASLRPELPGPHLALAEVYDRLGQKDDATRERAEGERLAKNAETD